MLASMKPAAAASYQLSGRVSDQAGTGIADVSVEVRTPGTSDVLYSTVTTSTGEYSLGVEEGIYDVRVIPPIGSEFGPSVAPNRVISDNTVIDFIIVDADIVSLSGRVLDALGDPLPGQRVDLEVAGGAQTVGFTGADGSYLLQVAAGTYSLTVMEDPMNYNDVYSGAPNEYAVSAPGLVLSQSTVLDVTLPVKRVSVRVQDQSGGPVVGVEVKALPGAASSGLPIGGLIGHGRSLYWSAGPLTDAAGNAVLWLFPGVYDLRAYPPAGGGYPNASLRVTVTDDQQETVTLQQQVSLSGRVLDALGDPLPGQRVDLEVAGGAQTVGFTGADGSYLLQVAAGTYSLTVMEDPMNYNDVYSGAPNEYAVSAPGLVLSQSTVLDVTLPVKRVSVRVQDQSGGPVVGVEVKALPGAESSGLPIGGLIGHGRSLYWSAGPLTDAAGNAVLWLFPGVYDVYAYPPAGGGYVNLTIGDMPIMENQEIIVVLQYAHVRPVTTATLTPSPDPLGNYPDPTTVTLTATAAEGYTIANTYYTIDGGVQQT
ncbi:MAG: carboxypeptidase-like regulatory domain-containing protein, partial [Patescibacteria group bacterium]|nr:carboxypeptidase-like regulatory domain-containing protein [Patescibacteria group bacterium]